ncbi:thimet oligopeptidase [Duganella sp. CF402]|uniref:M3 family metallopeptidase n=1 Tax=unclassified Duganella TaxID=2636909 RepID=UPI0008B0B974|nr:MULTISPECIES: M3 family metallopeptidase [unclassified Duganella]RZT09432.1 thimet oligopeptidase [Duganella sp. BK701]SEL57585.1 thimet oligopeptidase [Duganella sp. CF402]
MLKRAAQLLVILLLSTASAWADPLHAWVAGDDPAALEKWVDERLASQQASVSKLLAAKGKRTIANTLQPYDEAQNQLALAANQSYILFAVGATPALRDKAQTLVQKVTTEQTRLNLNHGVYQALAAVPLPANDAASKQYLQRTLLLYRLAGVDKDEATRKQVQALQDKIMELGLVFARHVQDGEQTITATRAELDGMPDDFIAKHKPSADGTYALSTDETDSTPVTTFANSADLRKRMYLAYNTRAYPANKQVLLDLLGARQQLAKLLGFPSFADLATADQLIGSADNVRKLLEEVETVSRAVANREYAQLLAFVQSRDPSATSISAADTRYWLDQYRRSKYSFDAQSVRPYFAYDAVERGILDAAARIFHVQFRQVKDAKTWHPSVTVFDVIDNGKIAGRIYLDMHPREGKDKWFSSAPIVPGIRGRQQPEGMLICNFPGGEAGDPGLMVYGDVITYFHEFGHLMHHILGSQQRWSAQGGFNVEGDFVEAPSQMLEEFFASYKVLSSFAKHYQTGEVLPEATMRRMIAADAYGRGRIMRGDLFYSYMSMNVHDRPVAEVDLDAMQRQIAERYSPMKYVDGNRMYASFTHLVGYSSNYYTYTLDKVIALDFYSRFNSQQPLDGSMTMEYRKRVIDPGASKPAAQLVKDFLGRPQSMGALKNWLAQEVKD